jgi:hypothetical protein
MPKDKIKRVAVPAILAMLVAMTSTTLMTGAFAVGPTDTSRDGGLHFVGSPDLTCTKTDDSATCTAEGEVAGAGGGGTATLSATVEATVGCINRGGGEPSGQERQRDTTTGSQDFTTRNGRGTFTVTTNEVSIDSFDFRCPDGMTEVIVGDFAFTDIHLTINAQTGTITADFPDQDP